MTGSIAGGRGLEALLVLRQLPLATRHYGRCVVVVWEHEAHGDIFEALQRCPVELVVTRQPSRKSFGFMEQQYKSLLAAMPYFSDDDVLVRVRTDYNRVLPQVVAYLNRLIDADRKVSDVLRGRIVCGEISVLHPGRVQEFNFAATKKSLNLIGWCESFYTNDYNPVEMEPEFRWFGLQYVMAEPLFLYCYEHRNMRQDMRFFFDGFRSDGRLNPDVFPPIIPYMAWRIANLSLDRFVCCLNLGPRNVAPDVVFNADRPDMSMYHDNIPDLRLTSHSVMTDVAGLEPRSPNWASFIAAAHEVAQKETKSPGASIELYEELFGPPVSQRPTVADLPANKDNSGVDDEVTLVVNALLDKNAAHFSSFRDYPSEILHALRVLDPDPLEALARHIAGSSDLSEQMTNRYATFCVVILCGLVDHERWDHAVMLLEFLAGETPSAALEELTRVVANRSRRFSGTRDPSITHYKQPEEAIEHDMLADLVCCLRRLQAELPSRQTTGRSDELALVTLSLSLATTALEAQCRS